MSFRNYGNITIGKFWPGVHMLRRMKYLSDQQGIINRYLRERSGWQEHLENTRKFVMQNIASAKPSSINVLGSGWLLDFPLEEVYDVCRDIILTDIQHPPQIIRKVKEFPGVRLKLDDVTGGMIQNTYNFVKEARKSNTVFKLEKLSKSKPEKERGVYYVSLNILNQLDILLVDYLLNYFSFDEQQIIGFRSFLQQTHIDLVRSQGCMVTDIEEVHETSGGTIKGVKNLLFGNLPVTEKRKEWTWNFDASGTYHPGTVTRMKVVAISC